MMFNELDVIKAPSIYDIFNSQWVCLDITPSYVERDVQEMLQLTKYIRIEKTMFNNKLTWNISNF